MKREWITKSEHGMTYHVSEDGGEMAIPVTWRNPEEFMVDLEQAVQAAFGKSVSELSEHDDCVKFHAAWLEVIKVKMRRT